MTDLNEIKLSIGIRMVIYERKITRSECVYKNNS